jgi:hypothetical protein
MRNLHCLAACLSILAFNTTLAVVGPIPAGDEFTFVVLGDSQFHDPATYNRMIDDVRHLSPAFVVQVGDMIEGYLDDPDDARGQWQRFRNQIAPLGSIAFLPVPGNHDLYNANQRADVRLEAVYRDQWGEPYYAFAYRNATFIVLNSDAPGEERSIGSEQWDWLLDTLKSSRSEHIFVFMHRPPASLKHAGRLHDLLRAYPVRYVFYGHHHHYHYSIRDGIGYVMTNAAADGGTAFDATGNFDHLLQVSVRDSQVRYAVIRADAVEAPDYVHPDDNYDLFELTRNLTPATAPLQPSGDGTWKMTISLSNPTDRDLTVYVQCGSQDERWQHEPRQIAPINLPGSTDEAVEIAWSQSAKRLSESIPSCELRLPYQTARGEWLDHRLTVQGKFAD